MEGKVAREAVGGGAACVAKVPVRPIDSGGWFRPGEKTRACNWMHGKCVGDVDGICWKGPAGPATMHCVDRGAKAMRNLKRRATVAVSNWSRVARQKVVDCFPLHGSALRKDNEKLVKRLAVAERSLNYAFEKGFRSYIRQVVLPRAREVQEGDMECRVYTKQFRTRFQNWNGMTAYQNFILELDCMSRINRVLETGDIRRHFPRLVQFDVKSLTVTYSYEGVGVNNLQESVVVPRVWEQLDEIDRTFKRARVVHLDMHRSGKNLLVGSKGNITVIDFDVAQAGGLSFNWSIDKRIESGKLVASKANMFDILASHRYVRLG